ncbi:Leucine-rich_repeat [Hexamita inflata]|uniref:Leucine-rich repeat n=1 Tax=Hexamita inflata TaxID=28002 RepID=A0AA86U227_9EUKA|nr:Leucine-rich repeat [Hexamita inflata]
MEQLVELNLSSNKIRDITEIEPANVSFLTYVKDFQRFSSQNRRYKHVTLIFILWGLMYYSIIQMIKYHLPTSLQIFEIFINIYMHKNDIKEQFKNLLYNILPIALKYNVERQYIVVKQVQSYIIFYRFYKRLKLQLNEFIHLNQFYYYNTIQYNCKADLYCILKYSVNNDQISNVHDVRDISNVFYISNALQRLSQFYNAYWLALNRNWCLKESPEAVSSKQPDQQSNSSTGVKAPESFKLVKQQSNLQRTAQNSQIRAEA